MDSGYISFVLWPESVRHAGAWVSPGRGHGGMPRISKLERGCDPHMVPNVSQLGRRGVPWGRGPLGCALCTPVGVVEYALYTPAGVVGCAQRIQCESKRESCTF